MRPENVPQRPATLPQIKAIYAIGLGCRERKDEDAIDALSLERFGVVPQDLTRRQAAEFIDSLRGT